VSIRKYIFVFLLFISIGLAFAKVTFAASAIDKIPIGTLTNTTIDVDPDTKKINHDIKPQPISYLMVADLSNSQCSKGQGLFNRIVSCTQEMIQVTITDEKVKGMADAFRNVGSGLVVLYILFFGIKVMAGGVEKVRSEVIIVFLTATFIVFFNNGVRIVNYKNAFLAIQSEFVQIATMAIDNDIADSLTPTTDALEKARQCTSITPIDGKNPIWQKMDCLVPQLLGAHPMVNKVLNCFGDIYDKRSATGIDAADLAAQDLVKSNLLGRGCEGIVQKYSDSEKFYEHKNISLADKQTSQMFGLFVILAGTMFSADAGFFIVITGLFIPILLIVAFGQAMYVYLTSYIAITVMALFAPLILPCFLFARTRHIFDQWLKILVSMTLKPGILLVYMTFMIYIFSAVLNYGGGINSNFRSLGDFLAGKSFENSTVQHVLWGKIESTNTNSKECYAELRKSKEVANIENISQKVDNVAFQNAQVEAYTLWASVENDNTNPRYLEYKEKYEAMQKITSEEYAFSKYIESLLDQYYADVKTGCKVAKQQWKYLKYNFAGTNSVEYGVQGILSSMLDLPIISSVAMDELIKRTSNNSLKDLMNNQTLLSMDKLKEAIIENKPIFPNIDGIGEVLDSKKISSPYYGDVFVEKLQKYLDSEKKEEADFFLSLLVILVVLAITLTFMSNVIEFGDQLAGLAGSQAMKMSNLYSIVSSKFTSSITR
jgi:type IV secretory pathway VirB6-like protein